MGLADGTVVGAQKILDSGPDAARLNVVLVAEGFRAAEQNAFNTACDSFVATLQAEPWFPVIGAAINVHRVNVESDESGADDPATCGDGTPGTGAAPATFFDASFCNSGIRRCLSGDETLVRDTLDAQVPQWHAAAVLVNTTQRGGCASGNVFFTALSTDWREVVLHELGHSAFDLADEYEYWEGCTSGETNRDNAPAGEPSEPNITTANTLATLKWAVFVSPTVAVPTMENPDCTACDPRPNVLADDLEIGLFEGAGYYHCGRYRPAYLCRMRNSSQPFCRVCVDAIARTLATFVTPAPRMEVVTGDGSTLLDFGDVAHDLTMYRSFEVRNIRTGLPGPLRVTITAPAAPFSLAPGTSVSFTLPAPIYETFLSRRVQVAFASSPAGGPEHFGLVTVATVDDPVNPSVELDLRGRAVPPPPVDSVLVIDRSGSMSEPGGAPGMTKVDVAIEAANLYVSLLRDGDRIGLVRYSTQSVAPQDVLLGMTVAGPVGSGAGRAAASARLNTTDLNPDGLTSIGSGIIRGSEVLAGATADARALVVLTDGIQNTPPDIPDATAVVSARTPRQRVFAVGLGLNQLEDRLAQIATVTNGVAQITGDLVDQREFLLQKLYVQILSDAADEAFVRDPRGIVPPGQRRSTDVYIGEVDVAADFILVFRQGDAPRGMRFWLEAPDGTEVHPADAGTLPNVEFVAEAGHAFFRWQFPAFPGRPDAHLGRWLVWVANDMPAATHGFDPGPVYYSVMCKARSDFRLGGRVLQAAYAPGSRMTVVLEPTLYGEPVSLLAPVEVRAAKPDGSMRTLTLARADDGTYRGDFDDTWPVGPYHFTAEVSATTPAGRRITRYRHLSGLIFIPGRDQTGGGQTGGGQTGGGQTGGGQTGGGQTGGGQTGGGQTGGGGESPLRGDCCEQVVRRMDRLLLVGVVIGILLLLAVILLVMGLP